MITNRKKKSNYYSQYTQKLQTLAYRKSINLQKTLKNTYKAAVKQMSIYP